MNDFYIHPLTPSYISNIDSLSINMMCLGFEMYSICAPLCKALR